MANRKRNIQMKFYVTEEEKRLIDEKMAQLPTRRYGAYLRKMAIDGYIIQLDTTDIKRMNAALSAIGRNINQIAKRVNDGCAAETADIEFAWTRRHAIDKGTNLGRHLIQAFQPGEVTPKQAHEIGMELAREILGGKYEFVLTTHIDRDHVHNHLIFNAVSFADYKHLSGGCWWPRGMCR